MPAGPFRFLRRVGIILLTCAGVLMLPALISYLASDRPWLKGQCTEIRDQFEGSGTWLPDSSYLFTAKCSEATFHEFARRQKMTRHQHSPPRSIPWRNRQTDPDWWTPPEYLRFWYEKSGNEELSILGWRDGILYYRDVNW